MDVCGLFWGSTMIYEIKVVPFYSERPSRRPYTACNEHTYVGNSQSYFPDVIKRISLLLQGLSLNDNQELTFLHEHFVLTSPVHTLL